MALRSYHTADRDGRGIGIRTLVVFASNAESCVVVKRAGIENAGTTAGTEPTIGSTISATGISIRRIPGNSAGPAIINIGWIGKNAYARPVAVVVSIFVGAERKNTAVVRVFSIFRNCAEVICSVIAKTVYIFIKIIRTGTGRNVIRLFAVTIFNFIAVIAPFKPNASGKTVAVHLSAQSCFIAIHAGGAASGDVWAVARLGADADCSRSCCWSCSTSTITSYLVSSCYCWINYFISSGCSTGGPRSGTRICII